MEVLRSWRADWRFPTTVLCIYGFLSTVKPMEPFLILYMTGPDKNLTIEQVNNTIFPVWTYSYLAVLVPVFLLTDWLRYKPVVMFQAASLLVTTAMLLWLRSVAAMQAMQVFYGVVTASEVAYFSYIYRWLSCSHSGGFSAFSVFLSVMFSVFSVFLSVMFSMFSVFLSVVALQHYRRATSCVRGAQLLGLTVGSVLGQLLVSFRLLSFDDIMLLTLACTVAALLASAMLPMPRGSLIFHRRGGEKREREEGEESRGEESQEGGGSRAQLLLRLWTDVCRCYSSRRLLSWSVWWAAASCGYNQTANYIQVLWEHVQPAQNASVYHGAVEAVSNLLGAAAAYGIGFTAVRWERWGELAVGGCSGLQAAALFLMTFSGSIWLCYAGYVAFKCLHLLLITIATFQVAADLSMERYALVFGVNTFGALVLQTIITSVVVDKGGLGLGIVAQFTINAGFFSVIAVVYSFLGMLTLWRRQRSNKAPESESPVSESPESESPVSESPESRSPESRF